jgi:hypothetical protein
MPRRRDDRDLVALADVAIGAERALAQLQEKIARLGERTDVLETKIARRLGPDRQ